MCWKSWVSPLELSFTQANLKWASIYTSFFWKLYININTGQVKLLYIEITVINHLPFLQRGDPTLSVLELWGAEYQESNALLLRPSDRSYLERVCQREKCPVDFVGNITGDSKVGIKTLIYCTVRSESIETAGPLFFRFFCYSILVWVEKLNMRRLLQTSAWISWNFHLDGINNLTQLVTDHSILMRTEVLEQIK